MLSLPTDKQKPVTERKYAGQTEATEHKTAHTRKPLNKDVITDQLIDRAVSTINVEGASMDSTGTRDERQDNVHIT